MKPDVLAPGVDVLSAWPGNEYMTVSGTSMAGPHLAGTVALMWSASPVLRGDIARTKQIIAQTAHSFHGNLEGSEPQEGSAVSDSAARAPKILGEMMGAGNSCLAQTDLNTVPNNVAGYGIVDAYAAVKAAQEIK
jgi:subtilisin family serine protease